MVGQRNFRKNPVTTEELIECYWYAVEDDLIGGFTVSNVNLPESQQNPYAGQYSIATFMKLECAEHMAALHNKWYQDKVYSTYVPNVYPNGLASFRPLG